MAGASARAHLRQRGALGSRCTAGESDPGHLPRATPRGCRHPGGRREFDPRGVPVWRDRVPALAAPVRSAARHRRPWRRAARITVVRRGRDRQATQRTYVVSGWTPELTAALVGGVKALVLLVALVTVAALLIWAERRLLALWQDRYGPNRVGPFGLGQIVADSIKLFTKEDWIPPFADKAVFVLAPAIVVATALISFAVVPFASG